MKNTWQKGSALLMVGVMMISTLVAFISAPVVVADTEITAGYVDLVFVDAVMLDEQIYDVDPADTSSYQLGEADDQEQDWVAGANTVDISILDRTNATTFLGDVTLEITDFDENVFDFNDPDGAYPIAPNAVWDANATVGSTGVFTFTFDILETASIGHDNEKRINLRISNVTDPNIGTFYIWIHIGSMFDDSVDSMTNTNVLDANADDGNPRFEAGDEFTPATLTFTNNDLETIDNLECILTPPEDSGITIRNIDNRAYYDDDIAPAGDAILNYNIDIAEGTPAGIYACDMDITYQRFDSGFTIVEPTTLTVDLVVDFSFAGTDSAPAADTESPFQCYASAVTIVEIADEPVVDDNTSTRQEFPPYSAATIEQSVASDEVLTFEVEITNNGNVDLEQVTYMLDIGAAGWEYFRNPSIYILEDGTPGADGISISFDSHIIGEVKTFEITVFVVNDVPIGEHRLPIIYDGYYWDDARLGGSTDFAPVNGVDGICMSGDADALELEFSIFVTDDVEIACHVDTVDAALAGAGAKGDITANDITMTLHNDEMYDFIDVMVRANFTGTPWYNPIIGMGEPYVWSEEANPASPLDTWVASEGLTFTVDTNPDLVPDRYPFKLEITAVINQTLEVVFMEIDYTLGCVVDFIGYGPRISISGFTTNDIIPGEEFSLDLTITNDGDDTLRDVWIEIPSDDTVFHDWFPTCDFIAQIQRTGENITNGTGVTNKTWKGSEVTLESLDIDSAKEIIELNLYIEGVYSSPSARITLIRLINLAPGESTNASFIMFADKDMVNGKSYQIDVTVIGIDSENVTTSQGHTISIMTSLPGESYDASEVDWFDTGVKALGLFLFLVIIIAILLMVFNKFKGDSDYDDDDYDEDEFGFEDDDDFDSGMETPAAPEEAPPLAPEEQLVEP